MTFIKDPAKLEKYDPDGKLWPKYQQGMAETSAAFPGKSELLWFVSTTGVVSITDWKLPLQRFDSAHDWAIFLGSVLSRWDTLLNEDTEDPEDDPWLEIRIPDDSDPASTLLVLIILNEEFQSTLATAREAIDLEHRRAAQFVMQQGGTIDLAAHGPPPSGVATVGMDLREIIPELNPNEWELMSAASRLPNGGTNDELAAAAGLEITNGSVRPVIPSLKRQKLIDKKNRLTEWGRIVFNHHCSNEGKSAH